MFMAIDSLLGWAVRGVTGSAMLAVVETPVFLRGERFVQLGGECGRERAIETAEQHGSPRRWTASFVLSMRAGGGACQGGVALSHAAKGCVSLPLKFAVTIESRSGLSVTVPMRGQSRMLPGHHAELRSRAWSYRA